ncbi:MAG TPA: hypothetical protein RMH85_25415 [Polyangiaceae bacterium LLY-WYZ-15_(1-7)]|nr:hypothetical protein [Myxococcales bacterium]MAT25800.1 hypothetical protein [Sandaracinus sp.]HJL04383.1 hypothetical protein [Polyangiaceae bacterium LLY-WYZ-15_(1-7)]MBJ70718.1 hypothetical protein [Sandaracinus sp.]HJL11840.1 hypothetical protein [Polyangiaceae bacterium LLY-WYZ-15_(1-7)]
MKLGQEAIVVREVLEGMLAPELAAAVLFEALEAAEADPSSASEWVALVETEVRKAVARRLSAGRADEVVDRVRSILGSIRETERPARTSQAPTHRFPTRSGPTRALIFAEGSGLARRLKTALGPKVVPLAFSDLSRLPTFAADFEPTLLVVDVADAPSAELEMLPAHAGPLSKDVLFVIWDRGGTPLGKALVTSFEETGRQATLADRTEGVDALLDLIRASQAPYP